MAYIGVYFALFVGHKKEPIVKSKTRTVLRIICIPSPQLLPNIHKHGMIVLHSDIVHYKCGPLRTQCKTQVKPLEVGRGGWKNKITRHQKKPSCCPQNTRTITGWALGTPVTAAKTLQSDHQANR